jgi:hypothetical protein
MGRASKNNHSIIRQLTEAVSTFAQAEKDLTTAEALALDFRASLRLIPRGIGSAIDARFFGAVEKHRQKKNAEIIAYLISKINALEDRQINMVDVGFFISDEFCCLFRDCWLKIWTTAQKQKLAALRGSLFSLIVGEPRLTFDLKHFFIKSLDVIDDPHIQVLRVLQNRFGSVGKKAYYEMQELYEVTSPSSAPCPTELSLSAPHPIKWKLTSKAWHAWPKVVLRKSRSVNTNTPSKTRAGEKKGSSSWQKDTPSTSMVRKACLTTR